MPEKQEENAQSESLRAARLAQWFAARGLTVQLGRRSDYDLLAQYHYRAGRPATIAKTPAGKPCIMCIRDRAGRLAAVLVVSMPTLNSSWRKLAWPGRFNSGNKSRDARAINRDLRCISRVIVDPRFRGMGIARALVGSYLAKPMTVMTEAVAAMGHVCPFFDAAGMVPYVLSPGVRDARLLDALAHVAVEPWEVLDVDRAQRVIMAHPWLEAEAIRWAKGSPTTRRMLDSVDTRKTHTAARDLLMLAVSGAANRPVAYAYTHAPIHTRTHANSKTNT